MRLVVQIAITALAITFGTYAAFADFKGSKNWYNSLPEQLREDLQSQLLLVGFYDAFLDGKFGPSTFAALTRFENSRLVVPDGILTRSDMEKLLEVASKVYRDVGFSLVEDERSQMMFQIPSAMLAKHYSTSHGELYISEHDGVELETYRYPESEISYEQLFEQLTSENPPTIIDYSSFESWRFVVSGSLPRKHFYSIFYEYNGESRGLRLSWDEENEQTGNIVSLWLASHSAPIVDRKPRLGDWVPDQEFTPSATPPQSNSEGRTIRFGTFAVLEDVPSVISLIGDIYPGSSLDFRRALDAFPEADLVVLNSYGGSVLGALLIANEIQDRGLSTVVLSDFECFSACAFVFFAGASRQVEGSLGVHQIWNDSSDLISAQFALSDILEALESFDVNEKIISAMLRTPPEEMYVFTEREILEWSINRE